MLPLIRTGLAAPVPAFPFYPCNWPDANFSRKSVTFGNFVELLRQQYRSRGRLHGAAGGTAMAKDRTSRRFSTNAAVPLRNLQGVNEIDDILRSVIHGKRQEVHAAIKAILRGWLGRDRDEMRERLRWLRNHRDGSHRRHAVWSEGDVELQRGHYAEGRAGARRAVKKLLARHPDWTPRSV